jgi:hypothetical protein
MRGIVAIEIEARARSRRANARDAGSSSRHLDRRFSPRRRGRARG